MTDRRPIQYAAGGLAGSAFIAVTQILTRDTLDVPLRVAVTIFATTIPFQLFIFFMPILKPPLQTSHPVIFWIYWLVQMSTTILILFGFVAVFWHFACWVGVLFFIAALTAFELHRRFSNTLTKRRGRNPFEASYK